MRTDKNAEPDPVYIKERLSKLLNEHKDAELYITQGYICRNAYGEIVTCSVAVATIAHP